MDANVDDIDGNLEFLVNVSRNNLALAMRRDGGNPGPKTFYFATQGDEKCEMCPYVQNELGRYGFATAILDESSKSAKMFSEATVPAANEIHDGCRVFDAISTFKDRNFRVGASTSMQGMFVGTIKNVRYYDRVLTEEEIVRNRNVDAVRYFGALGVTNVFVVAGGGSQAETGAYTVEGTWEFKASTVMNSDGQIVPVARYMIETFVDGKRESKEVREGSSFVYSVANTAYRGKTLRLTWKPEAPGTVLVLE